jgi:hypothetical protein
MLADPEVGSTGSPRVVFGASEAPVLRTIVCGEGTVPIIAPLFWAFFWSSDAATFRTIARGEIDGTPGCVAGELARDKMTAVLPVAPTAHATSVTRRV